MTAHVMGLRKGKRGWETGVVHARERHGKPAVELRGVHYHATLENALGSLRRPGRLNGHGGVSSALLGGTAGIARPDLFLLAYLYAPGAALDAIREAVGITYAEWSRRAGVNVRTIRRMVNENRTPLASTAAKLLEALQ